MIVKLSQYGPILTGRPFGNKVMAELGPKLQYPVILDFEGVVSLGSSFADEVVAVIAKQQGNRIRVSNAGEAIRSCLVGLADDHGLTVDGV